MLDPPIVYTNRQYMRVLHITYYIIVYRLSLKYSRACNNEDDFRYEAACWIFIAL